MPDGFLSPQEVLGRPKQPEAKEKNEKNLSYPGLLERVKGVEGSPDKDDQEIAELSPDASPESQQEGMTILQGYLIEIMARLHQKNSDLNLGKNLEYNPLMLVKIQPEQLFKMIIEAKLQLTSHESNALFHLKRLMGSEGETADYFKDRALWSTLVDEGISIPERGRVTVKKWYQEHPVMTISAVTGVALGLGYLLSRKFSKSASTPKEGGLSKKAKWGLGLGLVGAGLAGTLYYNRDHISRVGMINWMKDSVKDQPLPSLDKGVTVVEQASTEVKKTIERAEKSRKKGVPLDEGMRKTLEEAGPAAQELLELLEQQAELGSESLENPDGSDTVMIGDSQMNGMHSPRRGWKGVPDFVGKDGNSSKATLKMMQTSEAQEKLKGKKEALIYTGGNNFMNDSPEFIVRHMVKMAQICKDAGIPKIVICTRFPADPRWKQRRNEAELTHRHKRSEDLRNEIYRAYQANEFPPGTRIADLYGYFDDGSGFLKDEFSKGPDTKNNLVHPKGAYVAAINLMRSEHVD